jgi:hypothetical protein
MYLNFIRNSYLRVKFVKYMLIKLRFSSVFQEIAIMEAIRSHQWGQIL